LTELQEAVAKENQITIESICSELDAAIGVARERGQANAMVSAVGLRAKLAGLLVERQRIEVSGSVDFADCTTPEQIINAMLDEMLRYSVNPYHDLRPEDREHLAAMFADCLQKMSDYIEAIKARPFRGAGHRSKAVTCL
jgi:hypothetical protein